MEKEKIGIAEANESASKLLIELCDKEETKNSPEMVAAIAELLKAILY